MAGRQGAARYILGVPSGHDVPTRVRVLLDLLDDIGDLIDRLAVAGLPLTPLRTVNITEVTELLCEEVVI